MKKPEFLITENVPEFLIAGLAELGFEVNYQPGFRVEDVMKNGKGIRGILVRSKIGLGRQELDRMPDLKYILRPGSGLEMIDIDYAGEKGIRVVNSPEGNRDSVAEHAIGMLLSLLNHLARSFEEVRQYRFRRTENTGQELMGKTIGIIGYGNTGSAFARKLSGFDMKILAYDKYKSGFGNSLVIESTLTDLFKLSDIVSLHIPYNEETHYLADSRFFNSFQKKIYFINTSRGKITDTNSLLNAIQSGKVSGACLDVLENENPKSYTIEEKALLDCLLATGKVLVTPHIAGWTKESDRKIFSVLIEKLAAIIQGL